VKRVTSKLVQFDADTVGATSSLGFALCCGLLAKCTFQSCLCTGCGSLVSVANNVLHKSEHKN